MTTENNFSHSLGEEIMNAVTHGVGTLMSITGMVLLLVKEAFRPDGMRVPAMAGFIIFGCSLIFLYLMSTLYHSLIYTRARRVFQEFDHLAIYILIAGSYSAYCLTVLYDTVGVRIFWIVWSIALFGITCQLLIGRRFRPFSLVLYLAMGWILIGAGGDVLDSIPDVIFWWILGGGLCYTVGFVFYAYQKCPWMHPVWHIFVIMGSAAHIVAAMLC